MTTSGDLICLVRYLYSTNHSYQEKNVQALQWSLGSIPARTKFSYNAGVFPIAQLTQPPGDYITAELQLLVLTPPADYTGAVGFSMLSASLHYGNLQKRF